MMSRTRNTWTSAAAIVISAGMATGAFAQLDDKPPPPNQPASNPPDQVYKPTQDANGQPRDRMNDRDNTRMNRDMRGPVTLVPTDWIQGATVRGTNDEKLGDIKDLIIARGQNRVSFALLGHGGVLKIGEKVVAVPFRAFTWNPDRKILTLAMTADQLNSAPTLESGDWKTLGDPGRSEPIYSHFNVTDDRNTMDDERWMPNRNDMDRNRTNTPGTDPNTPSSTPTNPSSNPGDRSNPNNPSTNPNNPDNPSNQPSSRPENNDPNSQRGNAPRNSQPGSMQRDRIRSDEYRVLRVSDIKGKTLIGSDGREVGKVDDLIVDTTSGRIALVAVTFGGVLGIGEDRVAVPWTAFDVNRDGRLYVTNIDRDTIKAAPKLKEKDWGELRNPAFGNDVYRHYGQRASWLDRNADTTPGKHGMNDKAGMGEQYRTAFTSGTPRELSGTIQSIDEQAPMSGMPKVTVLTIKTNGQDTVTVHACPKSHFEANNVQLREGETVSIKGRQAMIDGQNVLIATQITPSSGRPITFRQDNGETTWR